LGKQEIREAAMAILSYFVRNPHAADDLEGVVRWRLAADPARHNSQDMKVALHWLVEEGLIVECLIPGGRKVFSLNSGRIDEARNFIAAGLAGGDDPDQTVQS
jgi:hypothetical protein